MDGKRELAVLREDWKHCTRCGLGKDREGGIVFGAGYATEPLFLFVYDVPTANDMITKSPLSGDVGNILRDILEKVEIDPSRCYSTAVLGCRPTTLLPATENEPERIADRSAAKEEVAACSSRLASIIYAVDPRLIFTLGDLSWKTLVRPKDRDGFTSLDKAIGNLVVTRVPGRMFGTVEYPVMPLLSVKQIQASPSMAKHGTIGVTMKHLMRGKMYAEYVKKAEQADRDNLET